MSNDLTNPSERAWLDLSLAQQSVWLDAKLSGTSAYQLGGWARVAAPLDEPAVRQSVRLVMARHDALRLRVDDDLPRQWLDASVEPPVTVHDLDPGTDPDAAFAAHVERVFATPMPLGDHPLFRIELVRAGPGLTFLLWQFHHLIADSASVTIALGHWFDAYDALTAVEPKDLGAPSSYLKTIAADAAYLQSAAHHQDLAYWSERFDPLPPPLIADMTVRPAGLARVPVADCSLAGKPFARFRDAAVGAGTTANRALLALFAVVLGRRYGQVDVVAGVALHRRDLSNLHAIGMMAGVIAVRWAFDPAWSLEECVASFSEQVDADLRHQRMPVDVLSRSLGLSGTGRAGLFEAAMSYIPAGPTQGSSPLDGVPVTTGVVHTKEASPISLHAAELPGGQGLRIHVAVNADFLEESEAAALATLLRTALDLFADDAGAPAEELPALSPAERSLVVSEWNRTAAAFERGTLDGLFAAQAARTPHALAVVGVDGAELTYAQLDEHSTRLARHLAAAGATPGAVVGVRMERSLDTVVALLGILKAGAVYLPLDPAYPADRLAYMAADAGATLVLDSIDGLAGDGELPELSDAERLAYVIYTSGTTGRPKGVAVAHAAAVNLAFARRAGHDPLGPGDRVLAAISVGFDVSIGQLLLPLLAGATVVVAGDVKTMGAAAFWSFLAERRVTHVNSVPSFLDSILDAAPPPGTLALRRLMLGGEPLSGALVGRLRRAVPGVAVVNMYGPTEACIDATYHIATDADLNAAVLPIGRPLANYTAYVLDAAMNPVGVGVAGELYLGGAGLAVGYVNAPELTAERFVTSPFGDGRLYKTGDRARWRADGEVEFLGRADQQVKVRGFRVEPAEVEAALCGHPAVAQAVVVARGGTGGSARLVAYVVPRSVAAVPEPADLRDHLARQLPEYMVPSAFVPIAEVPLSRNGKVDVGALPSPDLHDRAFVAPRTPTEQAIATLFAEVLGLDRCGATDHFFDLGGHSLMATSLVSKLHVLGMAIPLRAVFETPTVESLARRVDASPPPARAAGPIGPQPRPESLPLSFPQERIWFIDRLQQDSSYNVPVAFELAGHLDTAAVERAMRRIIQRHEALRTRIVLRDGRPTQVVDDVPPLVLDRVDLAHLAPEPRDQALRARLAALATHRFDLSVGLPFTSCLIDLGPDRHVLAFVVHHVAFDGWSAGLLLREFAALYAAFAAGGADPLPTLPIQYADFALWQRQQTWDEDRAFWLDTLRGAPARLELPGTDAAAEGTRRSGSRPVRFDAALRDQLLALGRSGGASLFMVLHAAFALLMSRLSGQDDVVIGTVSANRGRPELEPVIGCFVNTLALRTTFEAGEPFARLLARVKGADLAALAHQDLPFEQLVEALAPERSLRHTPVFQVMLVLQNAPMPPAELPGLSLRPIDVAAESAKFDLTLSLTEDAAGLTGTFEFNRNRFAAEAIDSLASQFDRLLRAVAADPAVDASRVDLLDPAERRLVVEAWNDTAAEFERGTLDGLFGAQARRTPAAVAVVGEDGTALSYADLDARSTTLARHLVSAGVGPQRMVGVRMARSTETVIALLAILKAGGTYLPLDPAYPADRLAYMAADAGAAVVLDSIDALTGDADLPVLPDPARVAYVIYTSGTTGRPKGVAVAHAAAVNLAFARRAGHDPLGPGDRVLAAISVGFDVSIGQLLLPLLSGATVVVAGDVKTMGAGAFWSFLAERRVTHVNSVPSFLDSILDAAPPPGTLALRRLMLGGEPLSGALVARLRRAVPGLEVVNMYGPTEACIDATYHIATEADLSAPVLPIGRPLANYTAYVLDAAMNPVGVGVAGELYLGGSGLAVGYVNAPELTAERFVANPFGDGRLYKTGDRARWRADGEVEFLGRADQQVKVRGFRVEPGETEAALRLLPGVRDAAVVAEQSDGSTRLIAYTTGDGTVAPDLLRAGLAATLPDYMVPAAFVRLDRLPLSPNGKLDRKSLPRPDGDAFAARPFEPPAGEVEERMAALWAELLKVDRVGRHDNFFELGGHSLLAVTLAERMRQAGLPGDVRALFTSPTVAGLAASTAGPPAAVVPPNRIPPAAARITPEMLPLVALDQPQIDRLVAAVPGGAANVQDIYPLSPLQEGILFQHLMAAAGDPYLTPFLLAFDGRDRLDAFVAALRALVGRHDVLRTSMAWVGVERPVQVVWREATLPVEEVTLDRASLMDRLGPQAYRLDLSVAPLLRVVVAREGDRWLALMLTHHLILDHTSLAVLISELRTLMADPAATLPPSPPYRNFIAQTAGGATGGEHEPFFTQMLGDVDEPTAPFGLLDVQADAGGRTVEHRLTLDPAVSDRARRACRAMGVTPASLFHLAWAAVLGHASGRSDVVFGTVLFGRMQGGAGADRTVGMFINTLPMRVSLDATGVADAVRRTHRLLADLTSHEHAPLAVAQRCSAIPPPAPLFSSLFNYRYSRPEPAEADGGGGIEVVEASERTNYPLAMAVDDTGTDFLLTALGQPEAYPAQVCDQLQHAMAEIVGLLDRAPATATSAVNVLPPAERRLVVEAWNDTAAEFERGTLDGLFGAQARRTPAAVAVVGVDGTELSYADLDARSTTLARQLVSAGVGPGRVVGVRMARSTETVIALLAILKAGGTYLPLDPAYPADRLAYMAADAGAAVVLDSIDALTGDADLPVLPDPARVAYVIYTSGTTGRPKGVAVAHAAAVNLAFARRTGHDPLGHGDRVLAAISVGFDVSIGQLLLPLLSGATVVVAGDVKTMGAAAFWSFLAERRVTHVNSVPSFLDSILDAAPPPGTLALRRLMLGGEPLSGALVGRLRRAVPGVAVVNMYGPTEACIDATYHIATDADLNAAVLPIGRPLANYTAYVLDAAMKPFGVGVAGELYLGGAGLAVGYVNAPDLTAERFVTSPFGDGRLYKTGDRARWRADGEIEFLGRADQQVKVRGFRVEPGEIEAQLRLVPGVREAAVVADGVNGHTRLVAYCVGDAVPDPEALRSRLASAVPDYMVPAAFVRLDRLPLSPNGKLDRKSLPRPDGDAFAARPFEPPVGEVEERMAALWAELLKVDRVGRHDNFFELGGHSLLAVTLAERMRQAGLPGDVRALFTSPTVAGLAAAATAGPPAVVVPPNLIPAGAARITPEMLPLVALDQPRIDRLVAAVPGGAANVQDIYPLSPLQEGILFQHLVTAAGDPYLAPFLLSFDRRDRLDAFVAALGRLVARHDVLRTAMAWTGLERPVQIVLREAALPVDEVSLGRAELMSRYSPQAYRLDLSVAPLLRAVISRDGVDGPWLLLMMTHHLVLDHTSLEVLVGELRALTADPRAVLPRAVPYRNFIAQTQGGLTAEQHEAFFRDMLGDVEEPTAPFGLLDVQADAGRTVEGRLAVGAELSRRLRQRSRAMGVTPASLLHLAWAAVLGHISGRSDVVFGTVLFGRANGGEGADRTVGMFINTLPVRLTLDATAVADAVRRTHHLLAELTAHEHAPLALAQRCSAVPVPAPLFSSLFNYRHSGAPSDTAGADDGSGIRLLESSERTNYPLSMAVDDSGTDFTLTALGQPEAVPARVCDHLRQTVSRLLDLLDHAPETAVAALHALPDGERNLVVSEWNRTSQAFARGTLHGLFAAQAARTPSALAVVGVDGAELTFGELDERSTRLARHLAGAGITPGSVVGVRMARSLDTVVALLGTLKAGGAYLPLDPAYPADRLDYMAADAGAAVVLDSIAGLTGDADLPVVNDDARVAYVIYTSGTTGRPKGVAVAHAAAVNLAFARRAGHDPLGPGDRVLAAISVGFDVSIGQLLLPLLSGATVVVAGDVKTMGGAAFWTLLADRRVTHVNSVPSFVDSVLDAASAAGPLSLRRLMLGGEPLSGALVARLRRSIPGLAVVNMYGPTEACIDATYHIATDADLNAAVLPIGRPLANYTAYVLDAAMNPVGVGVAGELYLGGAGLAVGYVNAPELTAERFVTSPFGDGRLYKTGDRARWRADGEIEFLGRVDQQVKVRGFRVEPGEIEAQLRLVPGVREAAVVVVDPSAASARLVAYCAGEAVPPPEALRAALAAVLPDHMVPAAFVTLDRLPLSPNGKLDRRALPKPGAVIDRPFEPPAGESEGRIANLWAELLGIDRVGRYDNFFELGGTSLTAMRMVQALTATLGKAVPIRLVFQNPTVAGLATAMTADARAAKGSPARRGHLVPLQVGGTRPPLYFVHASSGHVFRYMALARAMGPDQPVYGLQASGLEDGEEPGASVESMAGDYVAAIKGVQPTGPYHLLGYSSGGLLAFEMAQQLRRAGETVGLVAVLDTTLPDRAHKRPPTDDEVVFDMASALGIADLVGLKPPFPTLDGLLDLARRAGRVPADLESVHVHRMAAVFRNTVRTSPRYRMRDWGGHLLLIRAARRPREFGPMVDWSPHVSGELDVIDLDCSHPNLIAPAMAPAVAAIIADRLRSRAAAAAAGAPPPSFLPAEPAAGGRRPVGGKPRGVAARLAKLARPGRTDR